MQNEIAQTARFCYTGDREKKGGAEMNLDIHLYHLLVMTDLRGKIYSVEWKDEASRVRSSNAFLALTAGGNLFAALDIDPAQEGGVLRLEDKVFHYERFRVQEMYYYLIKSFNCEREVLKAALDKVQEGVQVYDPYANVIYMNECSRAMSGLESTAVEGKHLLDLYPSLDEEYSTTLNALRTRKPVYYRFDDYTSLNGKHIATVNTAFPLMVGKVLLGAVVFEQNAAVLQDKLQELEKMKAALAAREPRGQTGRKGHYTFADIIGSSEALRRTVEVAERVAPRDGNVLLVGETGTGKELFAQSLHYGGSRKAGKFVSINCAAVPETLIEGMLFGTTKGAFTGSTDKPGLFEEANDGTLFLDELGSMSLAMQSKILRVLQEGTFRRVGGTKEIRTNARIISACNEDPYRLMEQNFLRQDLFYRIATILIRIPPLRERVEDIRELAEHHLRENAARHLMGGRDLAPETLEILQRYDWPGNVRELYHALDYGLNLCLGQTLMPEHLPEQLLEVVHQPVVPAAPAADRAQKGGEPLPKGTLQELMDDYECQVLRRTLTACQGNISRAAEALGIKRQSLQYRIHKYGIIV